MVRVPGIAPLPARFCSILLGSVPFKYQVFVKELA